jgi:dienelactone hydrolase
MEHERTMNFEPYPVSTPEVSHDVYLGPENGPGVLLLHELMGLTDETFVLAELITERGFTVALPHMFGPVRGKGSTVAGAVGLVDRCIRSQMSVFARNQPTKGTDWLAEAASWLGERSTSPRGVAVIGMCATGAFAMAAVLDTNVRAVVASQAAFPVFKPESWSIPGGDVRLRRGDKGVMALRFRQDCKSAKRRVERLPELMEESPTSHREGPDDPRLEPYDRGIEVLKGERLHIVWADGSGHSVLNLKQVKLAVDQMVAFLHKNLDPEGAVRP